MRLGVGEWPLDRSLTQIEHRHHKKHNAHLQEVGFVLSPDLTILKATTHEGEGRWLTL